MRKLYIAALMGVLPFGLKAQSWQFKQFSFDNQSREYKTYHNSSNQQGMSVLLMLHGLGGHMDDVNGTSLTQIADTANVLLVAPQALDFSVPLIGNMAAWNSGIKVVGSPLGDIELNPTIDDVGFLKALVDTIKANYNVDPDKIYISGFSNGGFMTQRMLCEAPTLFRAAVSHSGTKALTLLQCEGQKIPVAHFHGTNDGTVDINGQFYLTSTLSAPVGVSADSLINYWKGINGSPILSSTETIGSTSSDKYITHYIYGGDKRVEFFKIHNGEHEWYSYNNTQNGFDLGIETWKFFLRADESPSSIRNKERMAKVAVYPNPATNKLWIEQDNNSKFTQVIITDPSGRTVYNQPFSESIDIQTLTQGLYYIKLQEANGSLRLATFVKN